MCNEGRYMRTFVHIIMYTYCQIQSVNKREHMFPSIKSSVKSLMRLQSPGPPVIPQTGCSMW